MARAHHAALAAACLVLAACVNGGSLVVPSLAPGARTSVELTSTPFFPQREFQCGPAALATTLTASGAIVTPDELTPLVYVPARHGSLQVELEAAPRRYARLTYQLDPNLDAILAELDAGRPVLVLHNYGVPLLPRWHYAVVVGYDAAADSVLLRSGVTERQQLSARNFMRAWDNGGRWAMVVLQPGQLPAKPEAVRYLESAAAFEHVARPDDAQSAFAAAATRWPSEPLAWIGSGTANYRSGILPAAARDYEHALAIDGSNAGARNNLAMTLLDLGCLQSARAQIEQVSTDALHGSLLTAVEDTRARIASKSASASAEPALCHEWTNN